MSTRKPWVVVVTGAGGFIGHHLVCALKTQHRDIVVRGVDLKLPEFEDSPADQFELLDLRRWDAALQAMRGACEVYALAADMGGMGFIGGNHAEILHGNTLINWHSLEAARLNAVSTYFFASSACIYPEYKQTETAAPPLRESDAYPAAPQDAYGWEKLMTEQLLTRYHERYGMGVHIARFHNVYGPLGTWQGGREKAPAAICRKVAAAKLIGSAEVEVWGDGKAVRSYLFIDDCVHGILKIVSSGLTEPVNLGQDEAVSVDELVDLVADIAGITVTKSHVDGPTGVRGRNSDNTFLTEKTGWRPAISLRKGLSETYRWIEEQVRDAVIRPDGSHGPELESMCHSRPLLLGRAAR